MLRDACVIPFIKAPQMKAVVAAVQSLLLLLYHLQHLLSIWIDYVVVPVEEHTAKVDMDMR